MISLVHNPTRAAVLPSLEITNYHNYDNVNTVCCLSRSSSASLVDTDPAIFYLRNDGKFDPCGVAPSSLFRIPNMQNLDSRLHILQVRWASRDTERRVAKIAPKRRFCSNSFDEEQR